MMPEQTARPRLFSYLTRTRFLHIEDALERRKLRFFIGSFERGHGANQTAYAFLDLEDARVILSDLADGRTVEYSGFGGGRSGMDMIISRVLKIQSRDASVWMQAQNGPGVYDHGIVKPSGRVTVEISIPLTTFDARRLGHACLAYLAAWQVRAIWEGR
jgi:hypothetical protein